MIIFIQIQTLVLSLYMILQIDVLCERGAAQITLILFLRDMRLHMHLQASQPRVTLAAVFTSKIPLTGVTGHVFLQPGRQVQPFIAQIALMLEDLQVVPSVVFP